METLIISLIAVTLLLALATVWNQNGELHKIIKSLTSENLTQKQELEKSKKMIKFLSGKEDYEVIKPEFLASLGIDVLEKFISKIKKLFEESFPIHFLEHTPSAFNEIGPYIRLIDALDESEEKEYLLEEFATTLFASRYQGIASLIYNSAKNSNNGICAIVIDFILKNVKFIRHDKVDFIVKQLIYLSSESDQNTKTKVQEVINSLENSKTKKN